VRVGILGPLLLEQAGRPVEVGGTRLRALLVRLALDPGRPVSAEALAEAVWGLDRPEDEANALQSLVSRLRKVLPEPSLIRSGPAGYQLAIEPEDVDAVRFERLVGAARAHPARADSARADSDPAPVAELLDQALGLWRGPALSTCSARRSPPVWPPGWRRPG
jgi:DNA-binding SARP family transcriptional activator